MAGYLALSHKKGNIFLPLAKDIGTSQKTAWFMLHRIRQLMTPVEQAKLSGTVEWTRFEGFPIWSRDTAGNKQ